MEEYLGTLDFGFYMQTGLFGGWGWMVVIVVEIH
jgi:hypothetical protein